MTRLASLVLALFLASAEAATEGIPWRVSAGAGIGDGAMPGMSGRILVGAAVPALRVGMEGRYFEEFVLFKRPAENIGAGHLIAGWEFSPEGPFSVFLFGGLGGERHVLRGRFLESEDPGTGLFSDDIYESKEGFGPSALLGLDVGASWRRRLGLSAMVGLQIAKISMTFALVQVDVGSW